ncbi:unnamed protein product [Euphydryas editha]|uniref:Uncharacterized protein n=1 Tax=Euphydryas editha TaxID=104508 RepID=A0AAU9UHN8_EUPED|nr:unnamed protein product [Euphydryas editha]
MRPLNGATLRSRAVPGALNRIPGVPPSRSLAVGSSSSAIATVQLLLPTFPWCTTRRSPTVAPRLEMNLTKTKTMTNNSWKRRSRSRRREVEKYIYLDKLISFNENSNLLEIERRVQLTWNKYWLLKEIFKSNMTIDIKTQVVNSSLLPCLTYGCQTWNFTTKAANKISTCQRGLERSKHVSL